MPECEVKRDVPVVFAPVINPVGQGIVESLHHSGGNVTGCKEVIHPQISGMVAHPRAGNDEYLCTLPS